MAELERAHKLSKSAVPAARFSDNRTPFGNDHWRPRPQSPGPAAAARRPGRSDSVDTFDILYIHRKE